MNNIVFLLNNRILNTFNTIKLFVVIFLLYEFEDSLSILQVSDIQMMTHYQHIANRSLWLNQRVETDLSQYVKMANSFSYDIAPKE